MSHFVTIPFSTLARNVGKGIVSGRVALRDGARDLGQGYMQGASIVLDAGAVVTLNFKSRAAFELQVILKQLTLTFLDAPFEHVPPIIPVDYQYPYPLLVNASMRPEAIVRAFVDQYFALVVPFSVLASCCSMRDCTLRHAKLVVGDKDPEPLHNLRMGDDRATAQGGIVLDFKQRVAWVGDTIAPDALLLYGGERTATTPVIGADFRCLSRVRPPSNAPFACERALLAMVKQNGAQGVTDTLRKSARRLFTNDETLDRVTASRDPCVLDLLHSFLFNTPANERHLWAYRQYTLEKLGGVPPTLDSPPETPKDAENWLAYFYFTPQDPIVNKLFEILGSDEDLGPELNQAEGVLQFDSTLSDTGKLAFMEAMTDDPDNAGAAQALWPTLPRIERNLWFFMALHREDPLPAQQYLRLGLLGLADITASVCLPALQALLRPA